ncbi:DNA ligase 1 isoform X4 [Arachis ipaensis]|uniref:DNA ligase 1 isoform X4 n=1 Tax=Arachis ipaensis TaxID=130454 RepID=UPI000A2B655C|nr:DNA ligase 1 isoform X4 [Arachis ipaensis]
MLAFRPCFFNPPLCRPISVKVLSFFAFPSSHILSLPFPHRTMTKPPSAFDALMSGARAAAAAAAKKKKAEQSQQPTVSSPKKRKPSSSTLPTPTSTLNPNDPKPSETVPTPTSDPPKQEPEKEGPPPTKTRHVSSSSALQELKKRIPQLKAKPSKFDPSSVACWEKGTPVPFSLLALALDMISMEPGRIKMTDIVCNLMKTVIYSTPEDLVPLIYLFAKRVAPAHEGLELGIGETSIIRALAEATGSTESKIKTQYQKVGDLGKVAKECRSSQSMMRKPEALTIRKVFNTFRLIAKESGRDSQKKKKNHIKALLVAATDCEPQYLICFLQGKLRIGVAEQTLLAALGQAAVQSEEHSKPPAGIKSPLEEAVKIVKQVYSVLPVYDEIVSALLTHGVWKLPSICNFTPGIPVGPMLSKPTKGISDILNSLQDVEFTCEYKYDGERAQVHYMENGSVEIYSRNAERNTGKFPDVVAAISRLKKSTVSSFVLDCEIVGYDREKQTIRSFQDLATRPRKNVSVDNIKVDVCIFAFDILYLNGRVLLQDNLKIRREHLYASFEEETGVFQYATAITSNDIEEIQKFLDKAVGSSCEGLIIKTLNDDSTYEPSNRSHNWLKLKKDYLDNIGDSLDLVPIAAFYGRGKRTGVYGAFLLACYDYNNEEFQSICKIGTGFTEDVLEQRSKSLGSEVIPGPKPYYRYGDTMKMPDVWFEASEVWEVKAADLTISPVYRAAVGIVDSDKGISLRFPRLVRVRPDKTPEQASSSEQVAEMYNAQKATQTKEKEKNKNKQDGSESPKREIGSESPKKQIGSEDKDEVADEDVDVDVDADEDEDK